MRIAQISPLHESVPPKLYGGTERVVSFLTEALVDLGHEVTLFASGDSTTRAELVPCAPTALRLNHCVGSARPPRRHAGAGVRARRRVRRHALPHRLPALRAGAAAGGSSRHHACTAGWISPELAPIFRAYPDVPLVSISDAQREPHPRANWAGTVYHGLPARPLRPVPGARALPGVPRPDLARKARRSRDRDRAARWGCR